MIDTIVLTHGCLWKQFWFVQCLVCIFVEKSLRKKNIMISYAWKQRDKDISSLPRKVCLFLIVVWRRRVKYNRNITYKL